MPGYLTDGMSLPPAGYAFTGNELIAVDTGLPSGQVPQTFAMPLSYGSQLTVAQSTPQTAFTISPVLPTNAVNLTPAGTLATGTINLPKGSFNGQIMRIFSSQTVTSLTLAAAAGDSIVGGVSALTANSGVLYVYQTANSTWYRA